MGNGKSQLALGKRWGKLKSVSKIEKNFGFYLKEAIQKSYFNLTMKGKII
jgi:hypothetical protein